MNCPCGLDKSYTDCCGAFINGSKLPATPEALMRSRYTAYSEANIDYIYNTMKSPAADDFDHDGTLAFAKRAEWLKLEIVASSQTDTTGKVEFLAHFRQNNMTHVIHEESDFELINGKWFYIDGRDPGANIPITTTHIGRNEPCLCGSGIKYKKCCGKVN